MTSRRVEVIRGHVWEFNRENVFVDRRMLRGILPKLRENPRTKYKDLYGEKTYRFCSLRLKGFQ